MFSRFQQQQIVSRLYKGKVIVVYGARRVGKTTICKEIIKAESSKGKKTRYLNAELMTVNEALSSTNGIHLKNYIGDVDLLVIDEAQHVKNIGLVLKILVDNYPQIQVIATGSSSFDLVNRTGEPLTGRARHFLMLPLALSEVCNDGIKAQSTLEKIMLYGLYPSVFNENDNESRIELEEIVSGYLYKDVLAFEALKHSDKITKLLQLLALQVGSEVSYTELGASLGMNRDTVEKYIDLLEKCFVVFRLRPFSRNLRKEIAKNCKVYFYDLGIRNCLIRNYNKLDLRNDVGALWENFCIVECMKQNQKNETFCNTYFWRHYNGQEVDYLEEYGGRLHAFEFKWNEKAKCSKPNIFFQEYNPIEYQKITRTDVWKFTKS